MGDIIYTTTRYKTNLDKSVKYLETKDKDKARKIFEEKIGQSFNNDPGSGMFHFDVQETGGCNPREACGCYQCGTEGIFNLRIEGLPMAGYSYDVDHSVGV